MSQTRPQSSNSSTGCGTVGFLYFIVAFGPGGVLLTVFNLNEGDFWYGPVVVVGIIWGLVATVGFVAVYGEYLSSQITRPQHTGNLTREGIPIAVTDQQKRQLVPNSVRHAVWVRDGGKCVECGSKENLEFDHIIPFSKGGSSTESNLQILCQRCNLSKGDRII